MFITNKANRVLMPTIFATGGDEFWKTVELSLHNCWYLLSVSQQDPDDPEIVANRTLFLHDFVQFEQILGWGSTAEFSVEVAQIITPSHLNGGDTWAMDRLTKVWSAIEPDETAHNVAIFETTSGRIYTDSWLRTPPEKLLEKKLQFELPC